MSHGVGGAGHGHAGGGGDYNVPAAGPRAAAGPPAPAAGQAPTAAAAGAAKASPTQPTAGGASPQAPAAGGSPPQAPAAGGSPPQAPAGETQQAPADEFVVHTPPGQAVKQEGVSDEFVSHPALNQPLQHEGGSDEFVSTAAPQQEDSQLMPSPYALGRQQDAQGQQGQVSQSGTQTQPEQPAAGQGMPPGQERKMADGEAPATNTATSNNPAAAQPAADQGTANTPPTNYSTPTQPATDQAMPPGQEKKLEEGAPATNTQPAADQGTATTPATNDSTPPQLTTDQALPPGQEKKLEDGAAPATNTQPAADQGTTNTPATPQPATDQALPPGQEKKLDAPATDTAADSPAAEQPATDQGTANAPATNSPTPPQASTPTADNATPAQSTTDQAMPPGQEKKLENGAAPGEVSAEEQPATATSSSGNPASQDATATQPPQQNAAPADQQPPPAQAAPAETPTQPPATTTSPQPPAGTSPQPPTTPPPQQETTPPSPPAQGQQPPASSQPPSPQPPAQPSPPSASPSPQPPAQQPPSDSPSPKPPPQQPPSSGRPPPSLPPSWPAVRPPVGSPMPQPGMPGMPGMPRPTPTGLPPQGGQLPQPQPQPGTPTPMPMPQAPRPPAFAAQFKLPDFLAKRALQEMEELSHRLETPKPAAQAPTPAALRAEFDALAREQGIPADELEHFQGFENDPEKMSALKGWLTANLSKELSDANSTTSRLLSMLDASLQKMAEEPSLPRNSPTPAEAPPATTPTSPEPPEEQPPPPTAEAPEAGARLPAPKLDLPTLPPTMNPPPAIAAKADAAAKLAEMALPAEGNNSEVAPPGTAADRPVPPIHLRAGAHRPPSVEELGAAAPEVGATEASDSGLFLLTDPANTSLLSSPNTSLNLAANTLFLGALISNNPSLGSLLGPMVNNWMQSGPNGPLSLFAPAQLFSKILDAMARRLMEKADAGQVTPEDFMEMAQLAEGAEGARLVTDALEAMLADGRFSMLLQMASSDVEATLFFARTMKRVSFEFPFRAIRLLLNNFRGGGGPDLAKLFSALAGDPEASTDFATFFENGTRFSVPAKNLGELLEGLTRGEDQEGGDAGNPLVRYLTYDSGSTQALSKFLAQASTTADGASGLLTALSRMADSEVGKMDVAGLLSRVFQEPSGQRFAANWFGNEALLPMLMDLLEKIDQVPEARLLFAAALRSLSGSANTEALRRAASQHHDLEGLLGKFSWSPSDPPQPSQPLSFRPADYYSEEVLRRAHLCPECGFRINPGGVCVRCRESAKRGQFGRRVGGIMEA